MKFKEILAVALVLSGPAASNPVFKNRAPEDGINHQYTGGWEHFVGGGVAAFDCDGDLFSELYVAGGSQNSILLRNATAARSAPVRFHENTPINLNLKGVTGAYPIDIDSDGFLDLFIMRVGENKIMKGGPNCSFSPWDIVETGVAPRWTTAFSATWEGENQFPTMAVGNYVDRRNPDGPFEACDQNLLLRPANGGYSVTPLIPSHCPLSMLFSDWKRQGSQDLRVSNDRHYYVRNGQEQLWKMQPNPELYSVTNGWKDYKIWGMGIASRDIDGDGLPEVFLTSMGDQKLQNLDPKQKGPSYLEASFDRGSTAHRPYTGGDGRPSTGWHSEFGDVNNDGLEDLFIAKGNVDQMLGSAMRDPNNLLIQQKDGTFVETGLVAGIANLERSRGAALVDLNLDGILDLVVTSRDSPIEIFENLTKTSGNWLLVDVRQKGANSRAIGAWVEVTDGQKTWSREITIGGGHAGGNAALTHFGLGASSKMSLRVIWPNGPTSNWVDIAPNQILKIEKSGTELIVKPI